MGYVSNIRKKVGSAPLVVAYSVMVVYDEKKGILLEEREDDGYWDFPGGSIEFNETAEEAAQRELGEETGLKAQSFSFLQIFSGPIAYHRYPNGDEVSGVDIVYLATAVSGQPHMQKEEVRSLKWWPLEETPSPFTARNKAILEILRKKFTR